MSYNAKVHHVQGGDSLVLESGGTIQVKTGGKIVPNSGTQAATIADLVITGTYATDDDNI